MGGVPHPMRLAAAADARCLWRDGDRVGLRRIPRKEVTHVSRASRHPTRVQLTAIKNHLQIP
jgi:hypothetical protein